MIKCTSCDTILSDGFLLKSIAVIQINYREQLCNIKCRKCKTFMERVQLKDLIRVDLIK